MAALAIAAAYAVTNIDDLLICAVLFADAADRRARIRVIIGKYIGIFTLFFVSILGAGIAGLLGSLTRWLGILPILIGIRAIFDKGSDGVPKSAGILSVAMLTVANGGDNIGVYVPMLAEKSAGEMLTSAVIFAMLTAIWCVLGMGIASLPAIGVTLRKYRRVIVPAVLIVIGISVILG